jgi:hypothetical protein
MPPKKQPEPKTDVINFYEQMPKDLLDNAENPNFHLHNIKLPFRMLIVAPSGSGKTNFLANLLYLFCSGRTGTFQDITILTKCADEPIYNYLNKETDGAISVKEGLEHLPHLDKMDKKVNHLVCFDDLQLLKNQEPIMNYYIRARKKNCSVIYLAQNFFQVPKVIRLNCMYFVILKLSCDRDMRLILKEMSLGLTAEQLLKMYAFATDTKFVPLLVNMEETDAQKKFRKGLLQYLNPADYA